MAWLTSAPREVKVKMPQAAAAQLASWPDDIAVFTPANKPLRSLADVAPGEEVDIFRRQRGIRLLITSASRTEQIQQNRGARVLFQGQ